VRGALFVRALESATPLPAGRGLVDMPWMVRNAVYHMSVNWQSWAPDTGNGEAPNSGTGLRLASWWRGAGYWQQGAAEYWKDMGSTACRSERRESWSQVCTLITVQGRRFSSQIKNRRSLWRTPRLCFCRCGTAGGLWRAQLTLPRREARWNLEWSIICPCINQYVRSLFINDRIFRCGKRV